MPKVPWTSEGAEKVIQDWEAITGKQRQGKDAAQDLARAQRDLGRISQRVAQQNATAFEKYADGLKRAEALARSGTMTDKDLAREKQRLRQELEKTTDAEKKRGEAAKAGAAAKAEAERQAQQIVRQNETAQERYNRQIARATELVNSNKLGVSDYRREVMRLTNELHGAGGAARGAFGGQVLASLKSFVGGFASIAGSFALIRQEAQAIREEAEKVTQSQLSAAQARDVLKRNIAVLGTEEAGKFERRGEALAAELSLPQRSVDLALAEAFSASGGDVELAFRRARVSGLYMKTSPEGMGAMSGSLGDISKATGDADPMRNLGFLMTVGALSRVADAQKQAATIPQTLASAKAFGATGEESGALFATISEMAADYEGNVTKTATINAVESLRGFFDERVKEGKFEADAVDTFAERLAVLRARPDLAKEFAETGVFGRAQTKGPYQEFFRDPNSEAAKKYRETLAMMGTAESQAALAESTLRYLGQGRIAQTAAAERIVQSGAEQTRLATPADLSRERRKEAVVMAAKLQDRYLYEMEGQAYINYGLTMSPMEAEGMLGASLEKARARTSRWGRQPTEEEKALIVNTERMVEELRALRQGQEEQNRSGNKYGRQE